MFRNKTNSPNTLSHQRALCTLGHRGPGEDRHGAVAVAVPHSIARCGAAWTTTTGNGVVREFAELAWRNRTFGDWAERLKRGQSGALGRRRAAVHLESIVGQPSIQKAAWQHLCA
jgi:hypothetical protein